jgi:transcriptional regulator with XRE-family HTH domain
MTSKTDKPHIDIGIRLKMVRKHLGHTQANFSKIHNYSQPQYANWESGFRRIPIESAAILEERYGITLDFIFLGRLKTLPHNLAVEFGDKSLDK